MYCWGGFSRYPTADSSDIRPMLSKGHCYLVWGWNCRMAQNYYSVLLRSESLLYFLTLVASLFWSIILRTCVVLQFLTAAVFFSVVYVHFIPDQPDIISCVSARYQNQLYISIVLPSLTRSRAEFDAALPVCRQGRLFSSMYLPNDVSGLPLLFLAGAALLAAVFPFPTSIKWRHLHGR